MRQQIVHTVLGTLQVFSSKFIKKCSIFPKEKKEKLRRIFLLYFIGKSYINMVFLQNPTYSYIYCRNDRYTKCDIELKKRCLFPLRKWTSRIFPTRIDNFLSLSHSLKKNSVCRGYRPAATNTNQEMRMMAYFCGHTFYVEYIDK